MGRADGRGRDFICPRAGSTSLCRIREGRIAVFPLFSVGLSLVLTLAAWLLDATVFIKLQPTIFNGLFALVLLGGAMQGVKQ